MNPDKFGLPHGRSESTFCQLRSFNFSLGAKSSQLLEDIQGVESRPPIPIIKILKEYPQLVEQNEWDSSRAVKLRKNPDKWKDQLFYVA